MQNLPFVQAKISGGKGRLENSWVACSVRVNDQWRICFRFDNGDAFDVEIADYH
jgi:proteic killer suppression protein